MGLIPFGTRRVGFWMPGRPERTLEEVPEGLKPAVFGTLDVSGVSLIVAAAAPDDQPEWAHVLYAARGAAVIVEWQGLLFVGLGSHVVLLDEAGGVRASAELPGEELVTAWGMADGLALFTRDALVKVDAGLRCVWRTELGAGQFQVLEVTAERLRVVQMGEGDEWDTVEIDAVTGAILSRTQ